MNIINPAINTGMRVEAPTSAIVSSRSVFSLANLTCSALRSTRILLRSATNSFQADKPREWTTISRSWDSTSSAWIFFKKVSKACSFTEVPSSDGLFFFAVWELLASSSPSKSLAYWEVEEYFNQRSPKSQNLLNHKNGSFPARKFERKELYLW
jgi:hypothetical protein